MQHKYIDTYLFQLIIQVQVSKHVSVSGGVYGTEYVISRVLGMIAKSLHMYCRGSQAESCLN